MLSLYILICISYGRGKCGKEGLRKDGAKKKGKGKKGERESKFFCVYILFVYKLSIVIVSKTSVCVLPL